MYRAFLLLTVLVVATGVASAGQLKCLLCRNAYYLDECRSAILCDDTIEECYLDKVTTDSRTIVYNGGCRATAVCQAGSTGGFVGRYRRGSVTCSNCCKTEMCNANLCGVTSYSPSASLCYMCDSTRSDLSSGDVHRPEECTSSGTCPADEMCVAQTISSGTGILHRYGCYNAAICKLLTNKFLIDSLRCEQGGSGCGQIKRANTVCSVCCNDHFCNSGSCSQVRDKLLQLYKEGVLDIDDLKVNRTAQQLLVSTAP